MDRGCTVDFECGETVLSATAMMHTWQDAFVKTHRLYNTGCLRGNCGL